MTWMSWFGYAVASSFRRLSFARPSSVSDTWVGDWNGRVRDTTELGQWHQRAIILAAGHPKEFGDLVARTVGVSVADVERVFGCASTEEYLIEAQGAVDVVVVSPELSWADILPMAEFVNRVYPDTDVVVLRFPDAASPGLTDLPGVSAIVSLIDCRCSARRCTEGGSSSRWGATRIA